MISYWSKGNMVIRFGERWRWCFLIQWWNRWFLGTKVMSKWLWERCWSVIGCRENAGQRLVVVRRNIQDCWGQKVIMRNSRLLTCSSHIEFVLLDMHWVSMCRWSYKWCRAFDWMILCTQSSWLCLTGAAPPTQKSYEVLSAPDVSQSFSFVPNMFFVTLLWGGIMI